MKKLFSMLVLCICVLSAFCCADSKPGRLPTYLTLDQLDIENNLNIKGYTLTNVGGISGNNTYISVGCGLRITPPTSTPGLSLTTNNSYALNFTGSTDALIYHTGSTKKLKFNTNAGEIWFGNSDGAGIMKIHAPGVTISTHTIVSGNLTVGSISVDDSLLFSVLKATSVAIGAGSITNHTYGIGIGNSSYSNYSYGIGVGYNAYNNYSTGIGIGRDSRGNHTFGIGIGFNSINNADYGIGVGQNANYNTNYGIGVGRNACYNQNYSIGIGYYATTNSHTDAVAIGKNASSTADNAWAIGPACVNNSTGTIKINLPFFLSGNTEAELKVSTPTATGGMYYDSTNFAYIISTGTVNAGSYGMIYNGALLPTGW